MTQFAVHPTIQLCDTCQELAKTYDLGPQDLLFTNDFLFDPYFAPLDLKCPVLFQEKYGLGEPTDEMVEAIYRDMPKDITRIVAVGGGTAVGINALLSRSFILSKYLFVFSTLLRSFSEFGFEAISSLYLRYWMHTDSLIKVTGTDGNACSVTLKGITDDGYLKGQDQLHRWVELYPDHNCEDSLANMIAHFP